MTSTILVLPGDGIGSQVIKAARRVLGAVRSDVTFEEQPMGLAALERLGRPYPADLVERARRSDGVLLGAVGGDQDPSVPWDDRPEAGLLLLRKELDLYANLRPVRLFAPLAEGAVLRPDLIGAEYMLIARELVGGAYFGAKGESDGVTFDTFEYRPAGIRGSEALG